MASYFLPILFVKKFQEKIWFYIDYIRLNVIIKKNCYLIPFIEEILAQLKGTKYFTKIDIYQAFYQIRISKNSKKVYYFFNKIWYIQIFGNAI